MEFKLSSSYKPTGDQPSAIKQLVDGLHKNEKSQTLLGVTGSGKTFTIANVIQQVNRPTLILSHNKTLAAQLYGEFKSFFPENAVEYFISYYDYYQPEAFIASTGTYIEKDLSINQEIEKLRLATTAALMSGRRDVIVIASVSCIYGMGNPDEYKNSIMRIGVGETISEKSNELLRKGNEKRWTGFMDQIIQGLKSGNHNHTKEKEVELINKLERMKQGEGGKFDKEDLPNTPEMQGWGGLDMEKNWNKFVPLSSTEDEINRSVAKHVVPVYDEIGNRRDKSEIAGDVISQLI